MTDRQITASQNEDLDESKSAKTPIGSDLQNQPSDTASNDNGTSYNTLSSQVWGAILQSAIKEKEAASKELAAIQSDKTGETGILSQDNEHSDSKSNQTVDDSQRKDDSNGDTHFYNKTTGDRMDYYCNDGSRITGALLPDCSYELESLVSNQKDPEMKEKVSLDGKITVTNDKGQQFKLINDKEVAKHREILCKLAEEKISDTGQLARFYGHLVRFEDRVANQLEPNLLKVRLSPSDAKTKAHEEITGTYDAFGKLLTGKDNPQIALNETRRVHLVEQMMQQAANPSCIDQGNHGTCNVSDIEIRTYTKYPAEATSFVVGLLLNDGKYKVKGGTEVSLDKESMIPHDGAKQFPVRDGLRSDPSQIFQVAAINLGYIIDGRPQTYSQVEQNYNDPEDSGERVTSNYGNGEFKTESVQQPALPVELLTKIGNQISGVDERNWLFAYNKTPSDLTASVDSPEKLLEKLTDANNNGSFPIILNVFSEHEPFLSDCGETLSANRNYPKDTGHVVIGTDLMAEPELGLLIDNTWGDDKDHLAKPVPLYDLYFAMRPASDKSAVTEQEAILKSLREAGKPKVLQELDCLALLYDHELIDVDKFAQKIATARNHHHLVNRATISDADQAQYSSIENKLDSLCNQLPLDKHLEILQTQNKEDNNEYKMLAAYEKAQDRVLSLLTAPEEGRSTQDNNSIKGFMTGRSHFNEFLQTSRDETKASGNHILKNTYNDPRIVKLKEEIKNPSTPTNHEQAKSKLLGIDYVLGNISKAEFKDRVDKHIKLLSHNQTKYGDDFHVLMLNLKFQYASVATEQEYKNMFQEYDKTQIHNLLSNLMETNPKLKRL